MFIELTMSDNTKISINTKHIESFLPSERLGGKTVINFTAVPQMENCISVKEQYEEVKALIEREVQAERGY